MPINMILGVAIGSPCTGGGGWWQPGASLHADFAGNRLFGSSDFATAFPITRASAGYADDNSGAWTSFGSGLLRRTNKGLKIEEARTNLFLNSLAPVTQTITVSNATAYTVSLWATGGTLTLSGAGTGTVNANGSVTFTSSSTSLTVTCNSLTGSFQCVNVEAGPFKTAPISTAGASTARAADVVTVASPSSYLSLTSGTIFIEWDDITGYFGTSRRIWAVYVDATNGMFLTVTGGGQLQFVVNVAGVAQCSLVSTSSISIGGRYKAAIRWGANDFAARYSASLGSPANDASGSVPTGAFTIGLGQNGAGATTFNSNVRQFATFLTPLTDGQLASMVA